MIAFSDQMNESSASEYKLSLSNTLLVAGCRRVEETLNVLEYLRGGENYPKAGEIFVKTAFPTFLLLSYCGMSQAALQSKVAHAIYQELTDIRSPEAPCHETLRGNLPAGRLP
jgi:hypothetical protein